MKSIGVFVDVADLYDNVGKKFPGRKLDYEKYLAHIVRDNTLYRAIAYGSTVGDSAIGFVTRLRYIGFEPKYRNLAVKETKVDWNVDITIDVVSQLERLDIVYLGIRDKRMRALVSYIVSRGRICYILGCNVSEELIAAGAYYEEIQESLLEEPKHEAPQTKE